jgi:transcriptional regulator with XRE-family HTH domain
MGIILERLTEHRQKRQLTKRELAKLCGFNEMQIHRYENGISDPSTSSLAMMAKVLDVSTDYLLGLSDNPQRVYEEGKLNDTEAYIVTTYRRAGWTGLIHLIGEQVEKLLPKPE